MSNNQKPNQASQPAEPREFWIDVDDNFAAENKFSKNPERYIHVIEYSAYQTLQEKLKIATEALKRIGVETDENNNFSTSATEAQFYIDVANEALAKIEGLG